MAARKKSTAVKPAPEQQASQLDTGPGDIAVDEQFADKAGPSTPVSRVRVRGEGQARAAGHVLTERGWVPEGGD